MVRCQPRQPRQCGGQRWRPTLRASFRGWRPRALPRRACVFEVGGESRALREHGRLANARTLAPPTSARTRTLTHARTHARTPPPPPPSLARPWARCASHASSWRTSRATRQAQGGGGRRGGGASRLLAAYLAIRAPAAPPPPPPLDPPLPPPPTTPPPPLQVPCMGRSFSAPLPFSHPPTHPPINLPTNQPTAGPLPGAQLFRPRRPRRAAEPGHAVAVRPRRAHHPFQLPAGDPGAAGGRGVGGVWGGGGVSDVHHPFQLLG